MSQDTQNLIIVQLARLEHETRSRRAKAAWQRRRERANSAEQKVAYGYVRATSDEDVGMQAAELDQLAQKHDIRILQIFSDDCSGMVEPLRRPGFQSVVNSLGDEPRQLVLAIDPTRITRSPSQLAEVQQHLHKLGAEIAYAD